jgi:AcrR family transcriptional regulator
LTKPIVKPFDLADPVVVGILDAATAEFSQHGLGGARLERIIANTHTSKRMVYYHFGGKEGLYQAVLEHVNATARFRDDSFDPNEGTPLEALARFIENAFESLLERPDFVRLITFENLSGATHVKASKLIAKLNQRGMSHIETIVARGQLDGTIRRDIVALDVYVSLVGLCYYHVANRVGNAAGGFKAQLTKQIVSDEFHAQRKRAVTEAVTRYAMVI